MKINKDQIKFLIKKRSLKQKDVARQLNVTQQDFNNWMFRGIFPHFNKLEELAKVLDTDVNTLYFDDVVCDPAEKYANSQAIQHQDMVPLFEIDGQLGLSPLWTDVSFAQPKDFLFIPGIKADFFVTFFGSGMSPEISNGDYIGLRRIIDRSFYNFGTTHAIVTQEQVLIKSLRKSTKKDHILLVNLENETNSIELPLTAVKALYAVVVIVKRNHL